MKPYANRRGWHAKPQTLFGLAQAQPSTTACVSKQASANLDKRKVIQAALRVMQTPSLTTDQRKALLALPSRSQVATLANTFTKADLQPVTTTCASNAPVGRLARRKATKHRARPKQPQALALSANSWWLGLALQKMTTRVHHVVQARSKPTQGSPNVLLNPPRLVMQDCTSVLAAARLLTITTALNARLVLTLNTMGQQQPCAPPKHLPHAAATNVLSLDLPKR